MLPAYADTLIPEGTRVTPYSLNVWAVRRDGLLVGAISHPRRGRWYAWPGTPPGGGHGIRVVFRNRRAAVARVAVCNIPVPQEVAPC